ncbi:MAG TPA: hypothetical protein VE843_03555, partial [Ktedonobacteraceae bacterium]|nr:hypothetical protein [Ktedonobacteraceae bacterium]
MSTATWGEQEPVTTFDKYPLPLLKKLLQEMIRQFGATGGCLALYDESVGLMNIRLHLRLRSSTPTLVSNSAAGDTSSFRRRVTVDLSNPSSSSLGRMKQITQSLDADQIIAAEKSAFFNVGTTYSFGQDLIGFTWRKNEPVIIRHEDYLVSFPTTDQNVFPQDITPEWYLCAPIQIPELAFDALKRRRGTKVLGVVVLYQTNFAITFQQKHRLEAQQFCERIALYILNDQMQHLHLRTMDYMQGLQQISTAFPAAVKLSKLVEDVYQFVANVVDVSSMLLTFYDRDTKKIYDVFAIDNGKRNDLLLEQPKVDAPDSRPVWWKVTQEEKRTLLLTLGSHEPENYSTYEELLKGTWGDQSRAETFLLLPMKMFTRVVGSLCLTSSRPDAYGPEEILILETMVQIITVSIENAKLYDRSRQSLQKAKQREESLATMNSALQVISTVLHVSELLQK